MEKVDNYRKWQRVLRLQCICLLGDHTGVWKYTKIRLDKLKKSISKLSMVDQDYFYYRL